MSRPYWSTRYVPTRAGLPDKLIRGRAYFVGDEQIMIIDYGNGPVEYGSKPGPQGIPGEPIPQLQGQIEDLAGASIETTYHLFEVHQKFMRNREDMNVQLGALRTRDTELSQSINTAHMSISDLGTALSEFRDITNERFDAVAEALNSRIDELAESTNARFEEIENVISIILKLLVSLYPNADIDTDPSEPVTETPLTSNEILTCESGSYKVKDSYADTDGGIVVILDYIDNSDAAYVETLNDGDTFTTSDGYTWKVENNQISDSEGTILLTENSMISLIETLHEGDTVRIGEATYIVMNAETENGEGTIRLISPK